VPLLASHRLSGGGKRVPYDTRLLPSSGGEADMRIDLRETQCSSGYLMALAPLPSHNLERTVLVAVQRRSGDSCVFCVSEGWDRDLQDVLRCSVICSRIDCPAPKS
jgi:hypothetical protein